MTIKVCENKTKTMKENNTKAFLELVRAGLWEDSNLNDNLNLNDKVDWEEVMRLAKDQSVVGLVTAGLEKMEDGRGKMEEGRSGIPKDIVLAFVGNTLQIERRNTLMNSFVAELIGILRSENIFGLLVKGQGIAQCYERPLWRSAGDIDLLLSARHYEKAKTVLTAVADEVSAEDEAKKHQALRMKGFDIELHGKMPFLLSRRVDRVIDDVQKDCLMLGGVRSWRIHDTDIFLPNVDNDVILVFTHFLHHFFIEGVGLRQICDWCRLLWTYRDKLDVQLLEHRIHRMGLESEWKAFAALAVNTLGMPKEAMPLYDGSKKDDEKWKRKGDLVLNRIMKCGNFGHNNDLSYRVKYTGITYKLVSLWRRLCEFIGMARIFPLDAPRFFVTYVFGKVE